MVDEVASRSVLFPATSMTLSHKLFTMLRSNLLKIKDIDRERWSLECKVMAAYTETLECEDSTQRSESVNSWGIIVSFSDSSTESVCRLTSRGMLTFLFMLSSNCKGSA